MEEKQRLLPGLRPLGTKRSRNVPVTKSHPRGKLAPSSASGPTSWCQSSSRRAPAAAAPWAEEEAQRNPSGSVWKRRTRPRERAPRWQPGEPRRFGAASLLRQQQQRRERHGARNRGVPRPRSQDIPGARDRNKHIPAASCHPTTRARPEGGSRLSTGLCGFCSGARRGKPLRSSRKRPAGPAPPWCSPSTCLPGSRTGCYKRASYTTTSIPVLGTIVPVEEHDHREDEVRKEVPREEPSRFGRALRALRRALGCSCGTPGVEEQVPPEGTLARALQPRPFPPFFLVLPQALGSVCAGKGASRRDELLREAGAAQPPGG